MTLEAWGWDARWAALAAEREAGAERRPARVVGRDRTLWSAHDGDGPCRARAAVGLAPVPTVGDWVLLAPGPAPDDPAPIVEVLLRRSSFSRAAAGAGTDEQVVAANVDRVWIVCGLDRPPNLRSLERYLALAWESGAAPEIVLTKADLALDLGGALAEVAGVAMGVEVRVVSVHDVASLHALREALAPGRTIVLLGPSGAGKSTLVNALGSAEVARTGAVREGDRKGRHTTTRRELFAIPGGALLLDTPGMRELRVWELGEGLERAFPDIDELAGTCRFRDCRHEREPGCAVTAAAEENRLAPERLESYQKLRAEAEAFVRRTDPLARARALSDTKAALKTLRFHPKYRDQG